MIAGEHRGMSMSPGSRKARIAVGASMVVDLLLSLTILPFAIPPFQAYTFRDLLEVLLWQEIAVAGWPMALCGGAASLVLQPMSTDMGVLLLVTIYPAMLLLVILVLRSKRAAGWAIVLLHKLVTLSFAATGTSSSPDTTSCWGSRVPPGARGAGAGSTQPPPPAHADALQLIEGASNAGRELAETPKGCPCAPRRAQGTRLSGRPVVGHGENVQGFATRSVRYPSDQMTEIVPMDQQDVNPLTVRAAS